MFFFRQLYGPLRQPTVPVFRQDKNRGYFLRHAVFMMINHSNHAYGYVLCCDKIIIGKWLVKSHGYLINRFRRRTGFCILIPIIQVLKGYYLHIPQFFCFPNPGPDKFDFYHNPLKSHKY